jgi:hypothetical protein
MAQARKRGLRSSAQDNFIGPNNVTSVTASDVGTGRAFGDGAITVSWTNPTTGNTPTGYKVYDGATLKATVSHPTSTATITGLSGGTSYTFTVKAYDGYNEASGTNAPATTATTVPATPSAPSASTVNGAAQDTVSWSAPNNGGKAITNYYWTSSDGKSGNTANTSVTVNQEAGSQQTYNVRADNGNGSSGTSANSGQVTTFSFTPFGFTPFGFTPFGAFSFVPFGFTPFGAFSFVPFGFTPFGAFSFTPFAAFGAFGFTPFAAFGAFGFTPFAAFGAFGFTPFSAFGAFSFAGFSFSPGFAFFNSISILTEVLVAGQPGSSKPAGELQVGDKLLALDIPNPSNTDWINWEVDSSTLSLSNENIVETNITSIVIDTEDEFVYIDGDLFSKSHYVLVQKGAATRFIKAVDIDTTYKIFSPETGSFVDIQLVEMVYMNLDKVSINCEPYDNFFTTKMLVFDRPDNQ